MRISIEHRTTYRYSGEITHIAQYLRLTPATNPSQRVIDWSVRANGQLSPWRDAYGNLCHTLVVERSTAEIVITAKGRVDTDDDATQAVRLLHPALADEVVCPHGAFGLVNDRVAAVATAPVEDVAVVASIPLRRHRFETAARGGCERNNNTNVVATRSSSR